jgi:hypothetical protein
VLRRRGEAAARVAPPPGPPPIRGAERILARAILVVAGGLALASFVTALLAPDPTGDTIAYHLPRIGYWLHDRAIHPFLANNPRIGFFPPNGEILQSLPVLFLRSDRLCPLAQLVAAYIAALAVYALGRLVGGARIHALLAAFLWLSLPAVLDQIVTSSVDLITAAFSGCAVYFMLLAWRAPSGPAAFWAVLSAAMAVGTKPTAAPVAGIVVAVILWRCAPSFTRRDLVPVGATALLAAPIALTFYVWNWAAFGRPAGFASIQWVHANPGLQTFVRNAELILAPPVYWLWKPRAAFDPTVPADTWRDALATAGLGALWPLIALPAAAWIGIRAVGRRDPVDRRALVLLAVGIVGLVFVLGTLRHQPAVPRLTLAVIPLLTAACAPALRALSDRRSFVSIAAAGVITLVGTCVVIVNVGRNVVVRVDRDAGDGSGGRVPRLRVAGEYARYDAAHAEMARAIDELGAERPLRIGLFSHQFAVERLAFGSRYQHTPVPLAYGPDGAGDRRGATALDVDAVWIMPDWSLERFGVLLFRPSFQPPPARRDEGWRVQRFRAFDEPFLRAHADGLFYQDGMPLVAKLTEDPGWRIVARNNVGLLMARGRDSGQDPRLLGVVNANGLERWGRRSFFWVGRGSTSVYVFRGDASAVMLDAEIVLGPGLPPGATRRLRIQAAGGWDLETTAAPGRWTVRVPLTETTARIAITATDRPLAAANGPDARPLLIGMRGLGVRRATEPQSADPGRP